MEFRPLVRKANYYETDKMGIIHHSNYIRWFEEGRIDFMEQLGYTFDRMEAGGVGALTIGVEAQYKYPVLFGDTVVIETKIESFTGTRMAVVYRITDPDGTRVYTTGRTQHCFSNAAGRPVSLKKANPELYLLFQEAFTAQQEQE